MNRSYRGKVTFSSKEEAFSFAVAMTELESRSPVGLQLVIVNGRECIAAFGSRAVLLAWLETAAKCGAELQPTELRNELN